MAHFIQPQGIAEAVYQGLKDIFQFTNGDGKWVPFNCGQAAACTYLAYHGIFPSVKEQANELMCRIEQEHPPDNFGGWFGTSRRRVERICRANGVKLNEVNGEEELRESLCAGKPVIVMLGVPGPKFLKRYTLPAGHWMVAYGFDESDVHLTNWGKMPWDTFRKWWKGIVPRVICMSNRGLAAL